MICGKTLIKPMAESVAFVPMELKIKVMTEQRNRTIDIAKGIAICLMVLGHSGIPRWGDNFIYMFHMPLFFILSGYCFKEKYLTDVGTFISHRLKGLYLPFVKFSLLFLILHNVFCRLHVYSSLYGYLGHGIAPINLREFKDSFWAIISAMQSPPQLLGGYWFLRELLLSSILSLILIKILPSIRKFRYCKKVNLVGVIAACLIISVFTKRFGLCFPVFNINFLTFLSTAFFLTGYVFRHTEMGGVSVSRIIISFAVVAICSRFVHMGMMDTNMLTTLPYYLIALVGSYMTWGICSFIDSHLGRLSHALSWIGENTLTVLTWHFLAFKVVSLFLTYRYSIDIEHLGEFPVMIEYAQKGWWIIYFIVAMIITLSIAYVNKWIHSYWLKL